MKLSEYIESQIEPHSDYFSFSYDDVVKEILNEKNYNIEVDPNPYLTKQYYIPFDRDDASVMVSILKEKLAQWKDELEVMRGFVGGDETLWCHLPINLRSKALDGFSIKENIDPWISQIHWAEYQIAKFKEVYANR